MTQEILHYDAIIIGSGQGGTPLAQALTKRGERVVLIESDYLGGTCINTGCTPTKTMVASAQVAHYVRNASRWGVRTSPPVVDMQAVLSRKNERIMAPRTGWEKSFNGPGQPEWRKGRARFIGDRRVMVGGEILEGKRVFIDTGTKPIVPAIPGIETVPHLDNVSLMELTEVPEHLLIIGGGYIGLEFAQMFRRFGSEVTVIQNGPQILPREDSEIAAELQKALTSEGIRFNLGARTVKLEKQGPAVAATIESAQGTETLQGSHLLVAVGRAPQTEDLDLSKTGVATNDRGFIRVNDRLETSAPGIWAIGDVTGGPAFTHISYNDYQIIYGNLYEGKNLSTKTRLVPYAVFTDPALGRVGMTEKEARASGHKLKIGTMPLSKVQRALERAETAGLMKLVVDGDTDKILGAAILSSEGGELVQILNTLMLADQPYTLLKGAIYIHPTFAEGFFGLMESVKPADQAK